MKDDKHYFFPAQKNTICQSVITLYRHYKLFAVIIFFVPFDPLMFFLISNSILFFLSLVSLSISISLSFSRYHIVIMFIWLFLILYFSLLLFYFCSSPFSLICQYKFAQSFILIKTSSIFFLQQELKKNSRSIKRNEKQSK